MYTNKNTKYVTSSRVIHISYILPEKSAKHVLFFIAEAILDWIAIALFFIILAPECERAFGETNCRVLNCLVLCG